MASISVSCGKCKNVVTTDEAMFYTGGGYGRRRVYYVRSNGTVFNKFKFVKRDLFAPGFMAWARITYYDKTSLIFIDKCVKLNNTDYYINKVLKPFLTKECFLDENRKWCSMRTRPPVVLLNRPLTF